MRDEGQITDTCHRKCKKNSFVTRLWFYRIMPNNSISEEVKRKRVLGLQREIQHSRDHHPHPNKRGSKGYDVHWRVSEIARAAVGRVTTCCDRSILNWKNRLEVTLLQIILLV